MIEQLDLKELPGADQLSGGGNIRRGRGAFARRVVVHGDYGIGTGRDREPENLARRN